MLQLCLIRNLTSIVFFLKNFLIIETDFLRCSTLINFIELDVHRYFWLADSTAYEDVDKLDHCNFHNIFSFYFTFPSFSFLVFFFLLQNCYFLAVI